MSTSSDASSCLITYPLNIFVDPSSVQDLVCRMPDCGDVVVQPPAMNCEHMYCGPCIADWSAKTCPDCRSPYSDLDGRLNRQIMGTIYKKRVYCRHRALGCLVEMEIGHENRNIIAHRQMCIFESVVCEQCHTQVQRGHIDRHNQEECPARPILCVNCGDRVPMCDMKRHQTPVIDPVLGDSTPCINAVRCSLRCRDEHGHILTFSPSALPSHEADCKRQLRPCAVCPPHHAHEMTYDDLRLHYRSKIRSVEHAVELLLMQSTGQTRVAVTSSIDACPPGGVSHYLPSPCKSPHGTVDPHRKIIIPSGSSVPSAAGSVASAPSPVDTKAATSFGPNSWALTKKPSTHAAASGVVSSAAVPAEPSAPEAAARPQARRAAPMSASSPTHAQTLAADSSSAPAAARLDVRSSSPVNTGAAAAWSHSSWATTTKPATPAPAHSARTSDAAHIAAANAVSPPHTATSAPPAYSSVAARTPMQPPSTGSMASPHSALTWPTPSPAHSSPAATTTVSASPCPAAHSAAFLTAPLPSSVPPVVHSEDHRRFVDSLVVGSFVEVFSKSNNTWKPARVTDVDFEQPDQLRLKALDGKKYLRPKMSTHIRRPEMPIPSPTALSANKKRKRAQSATAIDANAAHASTSAQPPVASHALSPVAAPPRTVAMLPVAPPTPAAEPVVAAIVATAVDPPAAEHFADGDVDAEEKEFDDGSANMDDDDRADRSDTADGADAESKQPHAAATTSSLALSPALVLTARERELQARWIMKLRLNSRVDYRDELEYHCWRVGRVVAIDHVKGILTVKPGIREKKDRREDPVAFDIKMAELLLTRPHTRSNNEQERYIQRCEQTAQEAKRRKFVDEVAAAAFTTTPGEEQQEGGGEDLGAPSDEPPSSPLESHPSAAAAADEDDGARDEF